MKPYRQVTVVGVVGLLAWGLVIPRGEALEVAQRRGGGARPSAPAARPAPSRSISTPSRSPAARPSTNDIRNSNRSRAGNFNQDLQNRGNVSRPSPGVTRPTSRPEINRPSVNQPIARPGDRPTNINTGNINRDRTNINTGDRITNVNRDRNVIGNTVNINRNPSISVQGSTWRGGGWYGNGYNRPPGWGAFALGTGLVVGATLASLPPYYQTVYVGSTPYIYSDGVFLQQTGNEYVVVAPPANAVVTALPDGCEPFTFEGSQFFDCSGVFYEPVAQNGEVVFVVVQ